MKFSVVQAPEPYRGDYDPIWDALLKTLNTDKSVRVELHGRHFGSVTNNLRWRLRQDAKLAKRFYISCTRDKDADAIVLVLGKNREAQ